MIAAFHEQPEVILHQTFENEDCPSQVAMNTFFYSARRALCPADCSFPDCAERCLYVLQQLPALAGIQPLPNGTLFPLSPTIPLRSGDLIVIHVATIKELETLVDAHQALDPYRLVLIVNDEVYDSSRRYHLLNPRYITTTGQAAEQLDPVVRRIIGQPAPYRSAGCQAVSTPS
jgi:hypothetical protein